MRLRWLPGILFLITLHVTGCAQQSFNFPPTLTLGQRPAEVRVLLMPLDIEVYELTAGGDLEPRADFTTASKANVEAALTDKLKQRNTTLVKYRPPTADPAKTHAHEQLIKLHDVVGGVVLPQIFLAQARLPTKKDRFDWGLGPEVGLLREDHDADFGLFIHLRDAHASPGRVGLNVVAGLLGGPIMYGRLNGFISLVDLRTGDIVYFNRHIDRNGDLRTPKEAAIAVTKLLENWPP